MNRRRDTTGLIYDILCQEEAKESKYHIMARVGLNFSQAENLLSFLLTNGHMHLNQEDGSQKYSLTPKGEQLRQFFGKVEALDGFFAYPLSSRPLRISRISIDLDRHEEDKRLQTEVVPG